MDRLDREDSDQSCLTKGNIRRFKLLYKLLLAISIAGAVVVIAFGNYCEPSYLNGLYILFIPIAGAIYANVKLRYFEKLLLIQTSWGKEEKRKRDFSVIRKLHDSTGPDDFAYRLDDQTWQDLHFDLLYSKIDRTFTVPGVPFYTVC